MSQVVIGVHVQMVGETLCLKLGHREALVRHGEWKHGIGFVAAKIGRGVQERL